MAEVLSFRIAILWALEMMRSNAEQSLNSA